MRSPAAAVGEPLPMQAWEGDSCRASAHSCVVKPWKHWWYLGAPSQEESWTMQLGFLWVEWHQYAPAGNTARFHIPAHFKALTLRVYKVLMLAKTRLGSHSWLFLTDPGELLNNLWGVCQLDRKELPWLSLFLFALLLWPPGSKHSRN